MPGNQSGDSTGSDGHPWSYERRKVLASLGLTGVAGLAGCGGDGDGTDSGDGGGGVSTTTSTGSGDGGPGGPTSTSTDGDGGPGTSTDDDGDGDDETTTSSGEDWPMTDRTWVVFVRPPAPETAQYNPHNGTVAWAPGGNMMRFKIMQKSFVNGEFQPELAKNWNYRLGVLEIEMFEDHYWVSDNADTINPINVDAEDWIKGTYDMKRMLWGDGEFPFFEETEQTGDHSFRIYFDDTYRQEYILTQTLDGYEIDNYIFWEDEYQALQDASSTEEEDRIAAEQVQQKKVFSPHPFTNVPFRVDSTTETSWVLTLRDDEKDEYNLDHHPRWVPDINWQRSEIRVSGETARARQAFINGELPYAGSEMGGIQVVDADVSFNTKVEQVPRPHATGGYVFNAAESPTSNVHFRRAFAYMLDREKSSTRFMDADRTITGFLTSEREERYLSNQLLDTLKNGPHDGYGYDSVMEEEAEAEMLAGGFERDSQGQWLFKEGDRAGQPMDFVIPTYPWQQRQANNATDFANEMSDFGITVQVTMQDDSDLWDRLDDRRYDIALAYWGGGYPTATFTNAFYPASGAIFGNTGWPGQWEGPPVGEFATPPGSATDNSTEYEIANMLSRLQITTDPQAYKETSDTLAWIYNQALPHVPIGFEPRTFVMNVDQWDWPLPFEDHPFAWVSLPRRKLWQRGVIHAKPVSE